MSGAMVETNLVYGMRSGLALLMDAWIPGVSNGRGVLFVGGSGWSSGEGYDAAGLKDRANQRAGWVPGLLAAGFTVFCANHSAAPRFPYPAALYDIQRALRYMKSRAPDFGIDPGRIGGLGGSSGAHLLCLAALLAAPGVPDSPDPVEREEATLQCLVLRAPPLDLAAMASEADEEGRGYVRNFVGGEIGAMEEASPSRILPRRTGEEGYATRHGTAAPPTMLIHGEADSTVPFQQSAAYRRALEAAGVPSALVAIPRGGHGPDFPGAGAGAGTPDYLALAAGWMERHLVS